MIESRTGFSGAGKGTGTAGIRFKRPAPGGTGRRFVFSVKEQK